MSFEIPQIKNDSVQKVEEQKIEIAKSQKEIEWENKQKEIESWGDKKGLGIDEKIKDTVVAFNLMGLPTAQSCEGHLESGIPVPWIRVEAPDQPAERFVDEGKIYKMTAEKFGIPIDDVKRGRNDEAWRSAQREISKLEETSEYQKWRRQNNKLMEKAGNLLGEFYRDKKVQDNIRLQIDEGGAGNFEIHNGGEDYEPIARELTDEQKKELAPRLVQYQEEMKKFTDFLRERYFKS